MVREFKKRAFGYLKVRVTLFVLMLALAMSSLALPASVNAAVTDSAQPVEFEVKYNAHLTQNGRKLSRISWDVTLRSRGEPFSQLKPTVTIAALPGSGLTKPTGKSLQSPQNSGLGTYAVTWQPSDSNKEARISFSTSVNHVQPAYAIDLFVQLGNYQSRLGADANPDTIAKRVIAAPQVQDGSQLPDYDPHEGPVAIPILEENRTIFGRYISEHTIEWTVVDINNRLDQIKGNSLVKGDDILPKPWPVVDKTQELQSGKSNAALYLLERPNPQTNSFGHTHTEKRMVNFAAAQPVPPGSVAISKLITTVTAGSEKMYHSLGSSSVEALKADITATRLWNDVDPQYRLEQRLILESDFPKKSYSAQIAPEVRNIVIADVDKFSSQNGTLQRIEYTPAYTPAEGTWAQTKEFDSVQGSMLLSLSKLAPTPDLPDPTADPARYGIVSIDHMTFDFYERGENQVGNPNNVVGYDSYISTRWKLPANTKKGDEFLLELPKEVSINGKISYNEPYGYIYSTKFPNDKTQALMEVYLINSKQLAFVATDKAASPIDLAGTFDIGNLLPIKGCSYNGAVANIGIVAYNPYGDGKNELIDTIGKGCDIKQFRGGVSPSPNYLLNPIDPSQTLVEKDIQFTNTWIGHDYAGPRKSVIQTSAAIDWDADFRRMKDGIITKSLYEEGLDYLTWEVLLNASGKSVLAQDLWLRDSFNDNPQLNWSEEPNIANYTSGPTIRDIMKKMSRFILLKDTAPRMHIIQKLLFGFGQMILTICVIPS
ncbi:hypothetical protein RQN30_04445 [Arcanobacterium hippocoleae]